jgi:hypothetical protein
VIGVRSRLSSGGGGSVLRGDIPRVLRGESGTALHKHRLRDFRWAIIAIISVVASSTVALAAVAAQVWQGHLNRENERRAWLRDRQAEAYISVLRLFAKRQSKCPSPSGRS